MDTSNIGIKIEGRERYFSPIKSLRVWLFWRDKSYPFNFIGMGIPSITKKLGITEKECKKLLVEKLEELLLTLEDEALKIAIEGKISKLRYKFPKWKTTRVCVGCGVEFIPKYVRQIYHNAGCREEIKWKSEKARIKQKEKPCQPRRRLTVGELNNPKCPRCGGLSIKKGTRQRSDGIVQMYQCYSCKRVFPESYIEKRGANKQ